MSHPNLLFHLDDLGRFVEQLTGHRLMTDMIMAQTPNFNIDLLAPAQAQKYVTVNEAFLKIDQLAKLVVIDQDLSASPTSPQDGDCYVVATGGTGDWAGQDGRLATFQSGVWVFTAPMTGWTAYVVDEDMLAVFDGTQWKSVSTDSVASQSNGENIGINTVADDTNRLAVKSDAVLFSHDDVKPGTGDTRVAINKQDAVNTASITFQNAYSGRAEFGLTGSDEFQLKVSSDGSLWMPALNVNPVTGYVSFPNKTNAGPRLYHVDFGTAYSVDTTTPTNIGPQLFVPDVEIGDKLKISLSVHLWHINYFSGFLRLMANTENLFLSGNGNIAAFAAIRFQSPVDETTHAPRPVTYTGIYTATQAGLLEFQLSAWTNNANYPMYVNRSPNSGATLQGQALSQLIVEHF